MLLLFPIEGSDWIADPLGSEVQRLASAICALVVQQSITVKASSEVPYVADWFEMLVLYMVEEKKWEITLDHRVYNLGEDDNDPAPFRHTWEICPVSVAVEAGDAMQVVNPVQSGDAMDIVNSVQTGDVAEVNQAVNRTVEAGDAVEVPRRRPWEL